MVKKLLDLGITGAILYLIYVVVGMLFSGPVLSVVAVILILVFIGKIIETFGISI